MALQKLAGVDRDLQTAQSLLSCMNSNAGLKARRFSTSKCITSQTSKMAQCYSNFLLEAFSNKDHGVLVSRDPSWQVSRLGSGLQGDVSKRASRRERGAILADSRTLSPHLHLH
jgi:hypothetical protein